MQLEFTEDSRSRALDGLLDKVLVGVVLLLGLVALVFYIL